MILKNQAKHSDFIQIPEDRLKSRNFSVKLLVQIRAVLSTLFSGFPKKYLVLKNDNLITVYIDMGTLASDTATLSFAFTGPDSNRAWEIKASQITCNARYA